MSSDPNPSSAGPDATTSEAGPTYVSTYSGDHASSDPNAVELKQQTPTVAAASPAASPVAGGPKTTPGLFDVGDRYDFIRDHTFDPTDNSYPYGDQSYVRPELVPLKKVRSTTIAVNYKPGKVSTLVYNARLSEAGLRCEHITTSICNPCSCAICNHDALMKYSFHRVYDDHVESNIATSCCCLISDNTNVFYFDRDWAQEFAPARCITCEPLFTHCWSVSDCCGAYGNMVIGMGVTNSPCNPGGRPITVPMIGTWGGPCCCWGLCSFGNKQWVLFTNLDGNSSDEFINKLTQQSTLFRSQHNVVAGQAGLGLLSAPDNGQQSRV